MILLITIILGLSFFQLLMAWEEFQKIRRSYFKLSWRFIIPSDPPSWSKRTPGVKTSKYIYTLLE